MRFALKVLGLTVLLTVASWFLFAKRTSEDLSPQSLEAPQLQLPPEIDLGHQPAREFPQAQLSCSFDLHYGVPELALLWNTQTKHKFASLREESSQIFSTDFWPNTGLWLSDSVLIVAGVARENGHTILERWTFEDVPEVPRVEWVGGEATLAWILPDRQSVERIYEGDEPGARHVYALIENLGRPGTLFASFKDSNHLYSIADGEASLAWPTPRELDHSPWLWCGHILEGGGLVYRLYCGSRWLGMCGSGIDFTSIVSVIDEDGDGTLDRELTAEENSRIARNDGVLSSF